MKNELQVKAIKNGTVIDHINAKNLFKIFSILQIENFDTEIFIGNNLESKKFGKKGIIKIANKFPSIDDMNKIALIDPNAIINIIEDYSVVKKINVELPGDIDSFVKCINPKCITNYEKVQTKFKVRQNEIGKIELKCHYCEKITNQDNIEIIK
ncbi:MAG: aspartate carbamoyltransferase regulatory subunit [Bacteroidales bacterium]|jgi:aspartate carbamoyltransferase regulatory subunit|nr:aspartate carbamoyltransferase regulatory subunit [Bacteroidales bacterium]